MNIALFVLIAIYLIMPIALYRFNHRRVAQFCLFMTTSDKCRRFYCYSLLLAVIYMHFIYFQSHKTEYGLMVSSLVLIAMFSTRLTEKLLIALADDNRKLWCFTVLILVIAFVPHLLTLAITLAIMLVGVTFYPSSHIRECDEYFLTGYYNQCCRKQDFRDIIDAYFK